MARLWADLMLLRKFLWLLYLALFLGSSRKSFICCTLRMLCMNFVALISSFRLGL